LLQPILTLPSGTELRGGSPGSAVKSLTLHTAVNAGQEFAIGSTYSDYIEAEIWADPDGSLQITAGDALTYYRQDDAGSRTKVGIFYAEKPTRTKRNSYKITAYDTMSKLDADFSGWLRANQAQFPKTIWQLVQLACQRAGVTLASSSLPINGSYSVQAFYADDLTCRQIISWAAEAAGCYAHMDADGKLEFLTYTDKRSTAKITPDGATGSTAYYADSLSYEDYTVKAIEKVQIRQSDSDVGVIYPDSTTATNTYAVQGNLLLTTGTEDNLKTVAQNLYNVLKNVTYTPCKVAVPSSSGLACGQIVHVKDARGREFDTYLMSATISSGKASFESVGSASRESSSAVNSQSYKNLTGRMLEIKTSVDGLEVKASDLTGKYADLKATVDEVSSTVSVLEETTTTISDDLDSTKQEFKTVKESVSSIDQKADSITQTVTQRITGGNNIITGTDDWNNASVDTGGNAASVKGSYTIDGESVHVTNNAQNTRFHFGADTALVIAKGMTYCASVLYKLNSGTDSLFLQFETKSSSGTKTYYGAAFKSAQQDIELDNGWKLRWAAFTATADGYADGLYVSTSNDRATVTNDLTIMHPMVQMGNAPTAWTASTGDYLTASETKTEIKQTVSEIKLTASTSGTSSTIKLTAGGTEISSAQINLSGVVTFSDLSTWNQDKTIINGGNITTGQIHNLNYTTVYDLDNAWIRMGTEAGERVYIDNRHIAWYATINTGEIGLTGVLYSEAGSSYIGACSKYAKYGWVDGLNPSTYVGMQITYNRSDDSDADFNTTRVGVSGTLSCQNLSAWGSKSRIVSTSFGALKMAAFETPTPTFADWGHGECGPDGWCLIVPDPRYAETVAQHGQLTWLLTDCDGTGHLWAEDCGQYAIVHGAPGQKFSWMAMAAQRGYEGEYAEPSECNYPAGTPAGIDMAASTAARALDAGADAADDLLSMDTGANLAVNTLLDDLEGNEI
jgi:hypothetical protein